MRILLVLFFIILLTGCSGKYNEFAECLSEKGAKMYGTDWCSHCQDQKSAFGKSFKYVNYINCDYDRECVDKEIKGYPTWIIDGDRYSGEQRLSNLASLTGCDLNE